MDLIYNSQTTKYILTHKTRLQIKLSQFITIDEKKFSEIIKQIDSSPEYQKLVDLNIISYLSLPHTNHVKSADEFIDKIFYSNVSENFNELLGKIREKHKIVKIIKKIGEENYKKFFLSSESHTFKKISEELKISLEDVKKIFEFTDEILCYSEIENIFGIEKKDNTIYKNYVKIAKISFVNNKPLIIYLIPYIFRGKYKINYTKLYEFYSQLKKEEKIPYQNLVKNLELINAKRNILHNILLEIINFQKDFVITEDVNKKKLLTQKMLAKSVGVSASTVCRVLKNKSIELPSGKEYSLESFVSNKKEIIIKYFENLSYDNFTDESLKKILEQKYGIKLSRRTVNYYRNLIKNL